MVWKRFVSHVKQITKRTPAQLLSEFKYLNTPDGPTSVTDISSWITSWGNRLKALEALDAHYAAGPETKRKVMYVSMPESLRKLRDNAFAKSNLLTYDRLKQFLTAYSNSDQSGKNSGPPPLTVGAKFQQQPSPSPESTLPPQCTDEEWLTTALASEGHTLCKDNIEDPTVDKIVAATLAKGKGKGNVGPKGFGQRST